MSQLEPLIKELQGMTSLDALPEFFANIQQQYNYEYCSLVLWRNDSSKDVISTKTSDDFESAISQTALRQFCQKRYTPALCTELMQEADPIPDALVVPLRGHGIEVAALIIGLQPEQLTMAQQIAWYWSIVANYLFEAIYRFTTTNSDDSFSLTCREQVCLNWVAKGKTSWEISQILSISERTVNFHLGNCIRKTNSSNRQQAISKCIAGGYILI